MSDPISQKPWATVCDKYGNPSGELVGNREGLSRLRDLIGVAIENGQAKVGPDLGLDFQLVRISSIHPKSAPAKLKEKIVRIGCFVAVFILAILVVVGGIKVFQFLSR
jgi:hypothetical protein